MEYPVVNSYDFTALLLETTNSKVTPYFAPFDGYYYMKQMNTGIFDTESQVLKDFQLIQWI